jgi:glycine/D-amino acid oxidase-like deaminating enzyme/nitrite reductase/ring-hydroxylating ferredoxin subunit
MSPSTGVFHAGIEEGSHADVIGGRGVRTLAQGRTVSRNESGSTSPLWSAFSGTPLPALQEDAAADTCIVGAGIAGLTTALLLAQSGQSVVVLDEKAPGGGETGRTSAHLASALDDRFKSLEARFGQSGVALHHQSHAEAIRFIERFAAAEHVECDFARIDGYLFAGRDQPASVLDEEFAAAQRCGAVGIELVERSDLRGSGFGRCVRFPGQARFEPMAYLAGLVAAIRRLGGRIYTGDRVMDLSGDGPVVATLRSGRTVRARAGVAATNIPTPINNWMGVYLKQAAYRSYVIGMDVDRGAVADALYWDMEDPYHYVRTARGGTLLLVGGEDHKTGQPGDRATDRFALLELWARSLFPAARGVVYRWSGQVVEPDDGVAFIGRVPTKNHQACFVITGDSGMGLTHGTLGAMIVSDLILDRSNRWAELYSPSRPPTKALRQFVHENANAAAQLADYLTPGEVAGSDRIARGSGAVVREGVHKIAVYRDEEGQLHRRSAVCPHLRCVVRWNDVERSWDCPCHGSRFDCKGRLITGPAVDDLPGA